VSAACAEYGEDAVVTATLLTSELITNALRHGTGEITIRVTRSAHEVRIAVADGSKHDPLARTAGHDDEGGRGLAIVDALASSWGVERLPHRQDRVVRAASCLTLRASSCAAGLCVQNFR
jgi:anti-sigma regulatory factor (Ser/Thr protein kinase)